MFSKPRRAVAALLMATLLLIGGCRSVRQPDRPIPPDLRTLYAMDSSMVQAAWVRVQQRDKETLRLLGSLTAEADRAKVRPVTSVVTKAQTAPSGDKHDYLSLSDYYWPNPDKPDAPYIRRDGQKNPEVDTIADRTNIRQMFKDVQVLGLAYYLGGEAAYAKRVAEHIRSWFINPDTRMNPNLRYAQMIKQNPRVPVGQGLIDVYNLPMVLDAVKLVANANVLSAAELAKVKEWFTAYLAWTNAPKEGTTSTNGEAELAYGNNRELWFGAQIIATNSYLGASNTVDPSLGALYRQQLLDIVGKHITDDGSMPKEMERTSTWTYSTFGLEAMLRVVLAAKGAGVNVHDNNPLLRQAVLRLVPYGLGEQSWPYPQIGPMNPQLLATPLAYAGCLLNDPAIAAATAKLKAVATVGIWCRSTPLASSGPR